MTTPPPLRLFRTEEGHLRAQGDGDWSHLAMFLVVDLNGDSGLLAELEEALADPGRHFRTVGNVYEVVREGDLVRFEDLHHDTVTHLPAAGVLAGLRQWRDAFATGD
ncbi:hypothetical protein HHL28_01915 [Aerophototrophica crusticola]|uniref:Uncharacterized protein n=1 Tax=Aerophototrophica crusticola TaxID=1709002 RepID=A0A858R3T4_9PROT|nr:hypothetical protein HHL28_01915 [Rhodospirillaceae bacterium B3]